MKDTQITIPKAKQIEKKLVKHDDTRIDNYYWLNDKDNSEVIEYLNSENAYYNEMTAHTKKFQDDLFIEMKSRIKEDDSSIPYKLNGYWYVVRFEKGSEYPIYVRHKEKLDAPEELLFDCNAMAKDYDYFQLSGISISPDNTMAAFGVDTVSRRQYDIKIKNLITNEVYDDVINNTTGSSTWANDNKTLFYTLKNPTTLRSEKIMKHVVGTKQDKDKLVFEEKDDTFGVSVYKSKSKKYIMIQSYSTLTTEIQILNANTPNDTFKLIQKRVRGLDYGVSHYDDNFYIVTNADGATNFKLMKTSELNTEQKYWEEVIPHREDVLLEGIDIFKDYLVINERVNGLSKFIVKRWDNTETYELPFDNETYSADSLTNLEFDTSIFQYGYNSLTTPYSVIDFDLKTKSKTIRKEQEVLDKSFDKDNYVSERIWATAPDGEKIPMSIVYHKNTKKSPNTPVLQYAYGSYGSTIDPYFSSIRLSLLNRGFIYVIAHVRGSEYLGRKWYDNGKLLNKKNTFNDFIACSKYLIANNYTSPQHLYAMGGSAGGLLMGVIVNLAPEIYNGIIAAVPFVDVVTTMLDDSIPLTTGEYDEWGNPNDKVYYEYMKSYSPYDNVTQKNYPNMLVTTGLHDSQVQYFEPAKWIAKLREMKTDTNKLYFDINMEAGHGGASGRFEGLKEVAKEYVFLFDLENIQH